MLHYRYYILTISLVVLPNTLGAGTSDFSPSIRKNLTQELKRKPTSILQGDHFASSNYLVWPKTYKNVLQKDGTKKDINIVLKKRIIKGKCLKGGKKAWISSGQNTSAYTEYKRIQTHFDNRRKKGNPFIHIKLPDQMEVIRYTPDDGSRNHDGNTGTAQSYIHAPNVVERYHLKQEKKATGNFTSNWDDTFKAVDQYLTRYHAPTLTPDEKEKLKKNEKINRGNHHYTFKIDWYTMTQKTYLWVWYNPAKSALKNTKVLEELFDLVELGVQDLQPHNMKYVSSPQGPQIYLFDFEDLSLFAKRTMGKYKINKIPLFGHYMQWQIRQGQKSRALLHFSYTMQEAEKVIEEEGTFEEKAAFKRLKQRMINAKTHSFTTTCLVPLALLTLCYLSIKHFFHYLAQQKVNAVKKDMKDFKKAHRKKKRKKNRGIHKILEEYYPKRKIKKALDYYRTYYQALKALKKEQKKIEPDSEKIQALKKKVQKADQALITI